MVVNIAARSNYECFLPKHRTSNTPSDDWWEWRGHQLHIARRRNSDAQARVIVIHGAGGNAAALFPVASSVLPDVDLAAIDLPLYGDTCTKDPKSVRYNDWVEALAEFVSHEDDGRPVVLFGASMGGLLAVDVANQSGQVAHVMATCLLDPHDPETRRAMMRSKLLAAYGPRVLRIIAGPLKSIRIPVSRIAPVERMSRDSDLSRQLAEDPKAGAVRIPVGFLRSFIEHPAVRTSVPVTLVHPALDAWTPHHLSERVLARFSGPTSTHLLEECGHFPIEEPGLTTLERVAHQTIRQVVSESR